jgi:hypothetical protein
MRDGTLGTVDMGRSGSDHPGKDVRERNTDMMVDEGSEAPAADDASMRGLLFVSGSALAVLAVAMTVTGVLLAPSGPTLADEVVQIAREPATRVSFVIASLLPAFVAPFTVALALWAPSTIPAMTPSPAPGRARAVWRDPLRVSAVILTILYAPLSVFAYMSQYLLVPRLAEIDADQAAAWYLGNESAFTLGLDLFAYLLWGSAAILIAWRLLGGSGLLRATAVILALSGITSVLAYPLHVGGSGVGGVLSAFSGGLSVVAAIAVVVHVARLRPAARSSRVD